MKRALTGVQEWAAESLAAATFARLAWRYGADRADAIVSGRDPATEADVAAWRNLGRGFRPQPPSTA